MASEMTISPFSFRRRSPHINYNGSILHHTSSIMGQNWVLFSFALQLYSAQLYSTPQTYRFHKRGVIILYEMPQTITQQPLKCSTDRVTPRETETQFTETLLISQRDIFCCYIFKVGKQFLHYLAHTCKEGVLSLHKTTQLKPHPPQYAKLGRFDVKVFLESTFLK